MMMLQLLMMLPWEDKVGGSGFWAAVTLSPKTNQSHLFMEALSLND